VWRGVYTGSGSIGDHALSSKEWTSFEIELAGDEVGLFRSTDQLAFKKISLRRIQPNIFQSQLSFYLHQLFHGDLGQSSIFKQPVAKLLKDGIGPSLSLSVPIFIVGLMSALVLSLICAYFRNQFIDRFIVITAVALMSINYLIYIVAGQYFLAYRMGAFPVWGYESVRYLLLPVIIGVVSGLGSNIRFYRTIMLDEIYQDYVRTALAKGVSKPRILFVHVLRNALIPIVTNVVIAIPFLYTGNLLLENFFGIPGLGYLGINAILSSDVDVVRALVLIAALLFVIANLLTDLVYAAVDPRVTLK
jgi:peptide/nickel transport system permease protein